MILTLTLAKEIMIEELEKNKDYMELKDHERHREKPAGGASEESWRPRITLRLIFWAQNEDVGIRMTSMLLEAIKKRFHSCKVSRYRSRTGRLCYKKDMPKRRY